MGSGFHLRFYATIRVAYYKRTFDAHSKTTSYRDPSTEFPNKFSTSLVNNKIVGIEIGVVISYN